MASCGLSPPTSLPTSYPSGQNVCRPFRVFQDSGATKRSGRRWVCCCVALAIIPRFAAANAWRRRWPFDEKNSQRSLSRAHTLRRGKGVGTSPGSPPRLSIVHQEGKKAREAGKVGKKRIFRDKPPLTLGISCMFGHSARGAIILPINVAGASRFGQPKMLMRRAFKPRQLLVQYH